MTHNVDNLMNLHTDVLCRVILYRYLSSQALYRFSRVCWSGYRAIQEIASFPQLEITLKVKVSFKKDNAFVSLEGEGNDNVFKLSDIDSLFKKVQTLAEKNGIAMDTKNVFISLIREDINSPVEAQNPTVSTLIFHRFMIETLSEHIDCANLPNSLSKDKNSKKIEGDAKETSLEANQPLEEFDAYHNSLRALSKMQTKLCGAKDLVEVLSCLTSPHTENHNPICMVFPEHSASIAKLLFRHQQAKDISAFSRARALGRTIGEKCEFMLLSEGTRFDITTAFNTDKHIIDTACVWANVVTPPSVMLSEGKTKNLTIPKLIFSHPDAANTFNEYPENSKSGFKFLSDIGNILLCAVRYRDPGLVQTILDNPYAVKVKDEDLDIAHNDAAKGGEQKSAKAIVAFKAKRTKEKNEETCVVS